MSTTLCERCFPDWGHHEVITSDILPQCEECGAEQLSVSRKMHTFRTDPRNKTSDTPRTDSTEWEIIRRFTNEEVMVVTADFARTLECELAAVTRERDEAERAVSALAQEVAEWRSRPDLLRADKAEFERDALRANRDYWQEECQKAWAHRDNANAAAEVDRAQIDALRAEVERLRGQLSSKRGIFQAGRDSYKTDCQPMNTDDEAWEEFVGTALQEPTP